MFATDANLNQLADITGLTLIHTSWAGFVVVICLPTWVYELPKTARKAGVRWKMKALLGLVSSLGGVPPVQWLAFGVILGYDGTVIDTGQYGQ